MPEVRSDVERGRRAYLTGAWLDAFEAFCAADGSESLGPDDLELLARSAYMLGRDGAYVSGLERAHHAHLAGGSLERAVRVAVWIGHSWMFRGEPARASGWFGRAQRVLAGVEHDCVERGYVLIPLWLSQLGSGDHRAGYATAVEAAEIADRFGDADLAWLARDDQGRALLHEGRVTEGLRLVDEALVAATSGELSPIVTGIVYCNTISFCRDAYQLRHAREWTQALAEWCARQPQMIAHSGLCLVHRAEIMQLRGAWSEAVAEARTAAERFTEGVLNQIACGQAHYRSGEIHRLRGEMAAAEADYREASRQGCEPQPGLALLRLAAGKAGPAAAAIRRAVGETTQPLERARLLPAYVEIMLAVGERERALAAARELGEIADRHVSEVLRATSERARGVVALADGDATGALGPLRSAERLWRELEAPYESAQVRMHIGTACRALGDEDAAELEFAAAREVFERVSAAPDVARVEALLRGWTATDRHGLTDRELEVLRLVAAGRSNREVATSLFISEHTAARHVQNIFGKLGVASRTAAGAFAFEHDLV